MKQNTQAARGLETALRKPTVADGKWMWRLALASDQLEANSCYAYLLLSTHFAQSCVVAERDGRVVGFVGGYRRQDDPEVIFVWQIGVDAGLRGEGIGTKLLGQFIAQHDRPDVRYLEATVTRSNTASQRLFTSFAEGLDVPCEVSMGFVSSDFGEGAHEEEQLYRIGPLPERSST